MIPFAEMLTIAGRFLAGMWPVMFMVVIVALFKRRDGVTGLIYTAVKALAFTWCGFALIRAFFTFYDLYGNPVLKEPFYLLPKDMDANTFLAVGVILLPLFVAVLVDEHRKRYAVKSLEDMQSLSPADFEDLVAETYRAQGHHVDVVGAKGDHGIDLVVHTRAGETWLVQCKKYKGKVGEPIVRDFYGALKATEASAGAVVTTGKFTEAARLWAEGKPLYLYDGDEFLKIIDSSRVRNELPAEAKKAVKLSTGSGSIFSPMSHAVPAVATAAAMESDSGEYPDKTPFSDLSDAPDCPACGVPMILQTKKNFLFGQRKRFICANAPDCRETRRAN